MPDDPNAAGGGTGAPAAAPEAVASPTDAELLASLEAAKAPETPTPEPDPEFVKKLETLDPGALPESVRRKLEAPFLSQYGKKTTELDNERQRLLAVIERLATKPGETPPTVDQKKQLLEEIANGNTDAIEGLVERLVAERTGPQMDYINMTRSIAEAAQMMPELPKYEAKVAEALQQDPELVRLASLDNRRYASRVLAALAWRQDALESRAALKAEREASDAKAKKAIEDYKAQLRGLPTSTSQAGKTPTAFTPAKPMTEAEIRDAAWEAGLAGAKARGM